MSDKSKKRWLYIALFLATLVIVWLLLRKNDAVQQFIKENVPWAVPLISDGGGDIYNIPSLGYVPATMPSGGSNKCDSNSPCIFCTIPNATYASKPITKVASPEYITAYVSAPKSFQQPTTSMFTAPKTVVGYNPVSGPGTSGSLIWG